LVEVAKDNAHNNDPGFLQNHVVSNNCDLS
jgi:hypothetical protein